MKKGKWVSNGLALLLAAMAAACAPARVSLAPSFWQEKNLRVGVALAVPPAGGAHKVGAQGLLDLAINSALSSDLKKYFSTIELFAFNDIQKTFVDELNRRGFTAKALTEPVDLESLPKKKGGSGRTHKRDFAALAEKEGLDRLVVLSVTRFGTIRAYYGFIPLGSPKAFFEVKGEMVDLATHNVLWEDVIKQQKASVPAESPWDQPPDYPNLTAALRKAMDNAKQHLHEEFFVKEER